MSSSRGRGRPRSTQKTEAILQAARELLLEQGFHATSMEMVAEKAGVGKPTIYNHFGTKEELLEAIVADREEELVRKLQPLDASGQHPIDDIEQFAYRFQQVILNMETRKWDRLVMSEVMRQPKLARKLFRAGPQRVITLVTHYIKQQVSIGNLHAEDPDVAAEHLLGLILGMELVRGQMASQPRRTAAFRRQRAKSVAWAFMKIYGTHQGDPS